MKIKTAVCLFYLSLFLASQANLTWADEKPNVIQRLTRMKAPRRPISLASFRSAFVLLDVGGVTIVGAVGFDWFPDFDLSKRHYYGPGDTWWGSDLAIVRLGHGRCIVSQLRLVDNLGSDPVADKILNNLIQWTTGERD